jgi:hypothetical protein
LSDYRLPVPSNPLQISANKNEFANMEKEDEKTPGIKGCISVL